MSDRSRLELAIWGAAVIAGSTIGGILALRAEPTSSASAAPSPLPRAASAAPSRSAASSAPPRSPDIAPPSSAASSAPPRSPAVAPPSSAAVGAPGSPAARTASPPAPPSDLRVAAVAQIKDALTRFVAWSHDHPGARCPDAAALGVALDPWGHALRITCTDQPADQMAGAVSAGPDGVAGTRDDVESWTLGADVIDPIRGPRWATSRTSRRTTAQGAKPAPPATAPTTGASTSAAAPPGATKPSTGSAAGSNDNDGIPDRR